LFRLDTLFRADRIRDPPEVGSMTEEMKWRWIGVASVVLVITVALAMKYFDLI
jgi:hypothetical protein